MKSLFEWRPIYLLCTCLIIICIGFWYWCWFHPITMTTVYLVRHAEKANDSTDPPLSPAGTARATELARVLEATGIDAAFTTQFQRTQLTAAPLAAAEGLTPQSYTATDTSAVAATILADHIGDRVLVVGHSTTLDDIAAELGAPGLSDLTEEQFDRLYIVFRANGATRLEQLRYGAPTP